MSISEEKVKWEIQDGRILLNISEDSSYFPNAMEIFNAEFRNLRTISKYIVCPPSFHLTDLKFSRIPVSLVLRIHLNNVDSESLFLIDFETKIENQLINITDFFLNKTDYILHDNIWHPFELNTIEEITSIFKSYNIRKDGKITLKQYFSLQTHTPDIISIAFDGDINQIHNSIPEVSLPNFFTGELYPYQKDGYKWLMLINQEEIGCILADEMGLGKTIQIICLIAKKLERNPIPSLVIAPATLLENWRREFEKFAPKIKTYIHQGSARTGFPSFLNRFDVIISSYSTIVNDLTLFNMIQWGVVVLDEAQAIKNPEALRSKTVKKLQREVSIAVTGTPVENQLTDLWSILDFSIPGLLGDRKEFEDRFSNDVDGAHYLEPLVRPVILKRRISEVAKDLPERIDIPQPIVMPSFLVEEYEKLRQNIIDDYGDSATLVSLIKLRQFCTDPSLVVDINSFPEQYNPKFKRLLEILDEIFENNEKVLIFTSFTKMIDLLIEKIPNKFGVFTDYIDGRRKVPDRQNIVDRFNSYDSPAALILNPAAAGTGLNLVGANHVIHYNLEWNPAKEDQASARAHRRGQTKTVTVHKMYFIDTIEDIINDRLDLKRELANLVVKGQNGVDTRLSDLTKALLISPKRGI